MIFALVISGLFSKVTHFITEMAFRLLSKTSDTFKTYSLIPMNDSFLCTLWLNRIVTQHREHDVKALECEIILKQ